MVHSIRGWDAQREGVFLDRYALRGPGGEPIESSVGR